MHLNGDIASGRPGATSYRADFRLERIDLPNDRDGGDRGVPRSVAEDQMWRTQIKIPLPYPQIVFEIILKKCFHLLIGCGGYLNMGLLGLDLLILVLGIFDKFLGI